MRYIVGSGLLWYTSNILQGLVHVNLIYEIIASFGAPGDLQLIDN